MYCVYENIFWHCHPQNLVLIGYLPADFEHAKKPKGGHLEIEFFLRKGLEGDQEPSKTLLHFFNQQKLKF